MGAGLFRRALARGVHRRTPRIRHEDRVSSLRKMGLRGSPRIVPRLASARPGPEVFGDSHALVSPEEDPALVC
jgi:hypothetical protein